jgi:formamidopyrimidine-DNA glycosylase
MPELPEVEHVKRQLGHLIGLPRRVASIEYFRKDLRFLLPIGLKKSLPGKELIAIERRAKYLLFKFSDGWLLSHLGMSGAWREIKPGEKKIPHDHVQLNFDNGPHLIFNDPRRFGFLDWVESIESHIRLQHLGPEPFDSSFTGDFLFEKLRKRQAAIKTMIMDQRLVVGVGNIYASEALFRAKVRPGRAAGRVTRDECERLVCEIKVILKAAIDAGGSTIRTYRSADGTVGKFQSRFFVYGRDGESCLKCRSTTISMKVIGGRSTFWCSKCQLR